MSDLPVYALPAGFTIRWYQPGDEREWVRIERAVGSFDREADALAMFAREFSPFVEQLPGRMLFLARGTDGIVGTTTAWFGEHAGITQGRIHWVAIVPEFQGRGLARPLLSAAMRRLAAEHDRAFLTTETTSYRGINLYLSFGFEPVLETDRDREGWEVVGNALGRKVI